MFYPICDTLDSQQKKANESKTLYTRIRRLTLFFGHVMRIGALENIVMDGKISCRRGKGRWSQLVLDGPRQWHGGISLIRLIQDTKVRVV